MHSVHGAPCKPEVWHPRQRSGSSRQRRMLIGTHPKAKGMHPVHSLHGASLQAAHATAHPRRRGMAGIGLPPGARELRQSRAHVEALLKSCRSLGKLS